MVKKRSKTEYIDNLQKRPKIGIFKKGGWIVIPHPNVKKVIPYLPETVRKITFSLFEHLETNGFILYGWHNFGKLLGMKDHYHCHLKKGNPTYVACWRVASKIIEVYYVGTHEKAPY